MNKAISFMCALSMSFIGCMNQTTNSNDVESNQKREAADSLLSVALLKTGDSILNKLPKNQIEVYAQTSKGITGVVNENWPDSIEKTFNLIRLDREPLIFIEAPYSESGDWSNTYTYYFDKEGKTRAIKTVSSFFSSECVPGVLTEEVDYIYDARFSLLSKKYRLHDEFGKIVKDTYKCVFNYRFKVPLYSKYDEVPLSKTQSKTNN